MSKNTSINLRKIALFAFGVVAFLTAALAIGATPTAPSHDDFLAPMGAIAQEQRLHFLRVLGITMVAIVPVFVLLPWILFKYRRKNKNADYRPNWSFSLPLEFVMWGVPFILIGILSTYLWKTSHEFDPYVPIQSPNPSVQVQVIGLDWKWLFIYPELGIASVGEMAMPVEHPLDMTITTDTVMQSFVIAALAGQIYAMPGMTTKLHVMADKTGILEGENMQYNGNGFAGQKFIAKSLSPEDFQQWVETVRSNGVALDAKTYGVLGKRSDFKEAHAALATPAMPNNAIYFTLPDKQWFHRVVSRYHQSQAVTPSQQPGTASYDGLEKDLP